MRPVRAPLGNRPVTHRQLPPCPPVLREFLRFPPARRRAHPVRMNAVRSLVGTVGVVLASVLLLLGLLLSPVLLPFAPLVLLVIGGWKFWRLKHKVERKVDR